MSGFEALGGAEIRSLDPVADIKKALARDDWRKAYAPERRTISVLDALIAVESATQYDIERERIMRRRCGQSLLLAATRGDRTGRRIVLLTLRGCSTDEIAVKLGLASSNSVRALLSKIGAKARRLGGSAAVPAVDPQMRLDLCDGGDV